MDVIINLFGGLWNLLAGFGGVVAVGCGVWAGIQFMLAQGDPQKVAQARMGIIGTVAGLIIMGVAFVLPGIISEEVVEPAGGARLVQQEASSCDSILQTQLRTQTAASNAPRMRAVVRAIQVRNPDCAIDIWNPAIVDVTTDATGDKVDRDSGMPAAGVVTFGGIDITPGTSKGGCAAEASVGNVAVPSTVRGGNTTGNNSASTLRDTTGRDANGNIVVHFAHDLRPGDNARCWLYNESVGAWLIEQ